MLSYFVHTEDAIQKLMQTGDIRYSGFEILLKMRYLNHAIYHRGKIRSSVDRNLTVLETVYAGTSCYNLMSCTVTT